MAQSGSRQPPSRPGVPCLIPVKLFAGDAVVDGVITRISDMAASVTAERPVDGAQAVKVRFRRPRDRNEIEVDAQVIGVSHEGGIWRGRPSLVLQFLTPLTDAPLAVEPPPTSAPEPSPPVTEPLQPMPLPSPERGAAPPGDEMAKPAMTAPLGEEAELDHEQPQDRPLPTGSPLPSEPFTFEQAPAGHSDFDFEKPQDQAGDWMRVPDPVPDAHDDWRDPWDQDRESDDSAELLPPPIIAATDAPEPEAFGFRVPGLGGEDREESTIDRLQHELQRSERRILTSLPVTFLAAGEERHGIACNFSPGGVYLAAEEFPRIGSVIHVLFPLRSPDGSEREVAFNGVVRWYRRDRPDLDLPDGFGLQIISFQSSEDRWLYTSFARKIAEAARRG
jgi:hypothetical protein